MLRRGLARAANKTALLSKLLTASPVSSLSRGKHQSLFTTPKDAIEVNGAPEAYPLPAGEIPMEYAAFKISPDNTIMHVAPHTPVQKKMEFTAGGEPRFFFSLTNPSDPYVIKAQVRDSWSNASNEHNRMRVGRIPCVIISPALNSKPLMIFVDPVDMQVLKEFRNINNSIYHVRVEGYGEPFRCLVRDFTEDSASGKVVHVSFMVLDSGRDYDVKIPVVLEGSVDSVAVRRGAVALQPVRHVLAKYDHALACKLGQSAPPRAVHVNVVDLNIGDTIHTYDIALPPYLRMDGRFEASHHVLCTFKKL
jgi:ribosomal protein L25 (general stress protein Ctc)